VTANLTCLKDTLQDRIKVLVFIISIYLTYINRTVHQPSTGPAVKL